MTVCSICGAPAECTHHLIFGRGLRVLANDDALTLELCNKCHNLGIKPEHRIHGNSTAESLSKMLGQMQWERDRLALWLELATGERKEEALDSARAEFRERYSKSYL